MDLKVDGLKIRMAGSVAWPRVDEMRIKLRQVWSSYQTLEAQEMLRAVDTMNDDEILEAYKTAMKPI